MTSWHSESFTSSIVVWNASSRRVGRGLQCLSATNLILVKFANIWTVWHNKVIGVSLRNKSVRGYWGGKVNLRVEGWPKCHKKWLLLLFWLERQGGGQSYWLCCCHCKSCGKVLLVQFQHQKLAKFNHQLVTRRSTLNCWFGVLLRADMFDLKSQLCASVIKINQSKSTTSNNLAQKLLWFCNICKCNLNKLIKFNQSCTEFIFLANTIISKYWNLVI